MRLADVYLMYAEAVNEWKGDPNATADGYPLTALEAVNLVRRRAGMPEVTAGAEAYSGDFRELVLNERAVELAFEGHYWFDQRRWKRRPDRILYDLRFDEDYTFFSREPVLNTVFLDRHWWLPFPSSISSVADFTQNPGW